MATNGQHQGSCRPGSLSYVVGTLKWNRTSYSIDNNSSTINWSLEITNTGTIILGDVFMPSSDCYVYINGTQVFSNKVDAGIAVNKTKTLASGTVVIPHNPDGTKTFSVEAGVPYANTTMYINDTATLDTVPRPTVIDTAPDFTSSNWPKITYKCPGTITGTLEACISLTGEKDDVPYRTIENPTNPGEYRFIFTAEEERTLYAAVKTGSSITVRFYIRNTINGGQYPSYLTKTYTLTNYTPTLEPEIIDINPSTLELTGNPSKLIKGHSNAQITFNAAARRGASIVSKTLTTGNQTINIDGDSTDVVKVDAVQTGVFSLSVVDSRNNSTKEVIDIGEDFIPYHKTSCHLKVALNANGTATLVVKGNYFNGHFGAKNNSLKIEVRHRENGGNWGTWGDITPLLTDIGDGVYTLNGNISGYDVSGVYDFQCKASDRLTSANSAIETISLHPIFDWSNLDFNFNVPITIQGNLLDDFIIESGTEAMGTNGTWYWYKWKSGRAECYGCRNYGNMAVSTAWGNQFRSQAFTQNLPTGLFSNTPEVIDISLRSGGYGGTTVRYEATAPSAGNTGSFIVVRPASASISQAHISFNIIGRWK